MADSRIAPRVFVLMLSVFAGIAVSLSVMGIYSVASLSVARRTREIGLRAALGAGQRQVSWLFLRRSLGYLAIGLPAGILGALGVGQLLRSVLVQVGPTDPLTLAGNRPALGRRMYRGRSYPGPESGSPRPDGCPAGRIVSTPEVAARVPTGSADGPPGIKSHRIPARPPPTAVRPGGFPATTRTLGIETKPSPGSASPSRNAQQGGLPRAVRTDEPVAFSGVQEADGAGQEGPVAEGPLEAARRDHGRIQRMSAGPGGWSGHGLHAGTPEPGRSAPGRVSYGFRVGGGTCQGAPWPG